MNTFVDTQDDIHDELGDSQPGDFTIEQWVLAWGPPCSDKRSQIFAAAAIIGVAI